MVDLHDLAIGKSYIVKAGMYGTEGNNVHANVQMRLIDLCKYVARFERPAGYIEAFDYWMLQRVLIEEV